MLGLACSQAYTIKLIAILSYAKYCNTKQGWGVGLAKPARATPRRAWLRGLAIRLEITEPYTVQLF